MDDLIYFLFLIAWLAFSFYQQSAKKKKRQEQMRAAQEREKQRQEQEEFSGSEAVNESGARQVSPVAGQKPKPEQDFRKTLEEILLGEEIREEEVRPPSGRYEQDSRPEENKSTGTTQKNVFQKYYDEEMLEGSQENLENHYEPEKIEDQIEKLEEEMVLQEEETIDEPADKPDFDLRKAIIYSEIINRRYN